jgi:hypothetical protein
MESLIWSRILDWFFQHPTEKVHFKELCRNIKLSPVSLKSYCDHFIQRGWVLEEKKANLRLFYLNNKDYGVKALKRSWILEKLRSNKIENIVDENIIAFALYGSYASGEFDERSDIDLLVIGRKEQVNYDKIKNLREKMNKEVQVTVIPLHKWEKNKKTDPFILSVLRNHVLLKGMAL